jgi:hypothetical protein
MGECYTVESPSIVRGSGHRPEKNFGFLLFLESVQTLIQKLIVECCTLESPSSVQRGSGHRPEIFFFFWVPTFLESIETLIHKLIVERCTPESPSNARGSGRRPEFFFGFLLFLESVQTLI